MNISYGNRTFLTTNEVLSDRLNELSPSGRGFFAGYSVKVGPGTSDVREQLLEQFVNLFALENIEQEAKSTLKSLIEGSETFKRKVSHIDQITSEDLMQIRLEIQLNKAFLSKASEAELNELLLSSREMEPQLRIGLLSKLAKHYKKIDDTPKAVECYTRILEDIKNVDKIYQISIIDDAMRYLVKIYKKESNTVKLTECYEVVIDNPDFFDKSYVQDAYRNLIEFNKDDITKVIKYYNQYLLDKNISFEIVTKTPNKHTRELHDKIYELLENAGEAELNDLLSSSESLNPDIRFMLWYQLGDCYRTARNESGSIECYKKQFENLKGSTMVDDSDKQHIFEYLLRSDSENLIEYCETVINNPAHFPLSIVLSSYEKLVNAHEKDLTKAIEYYNQFLSSRNLAFKGAGDEFTKFNRVIYDKIFKFFANAQEVELEKLEPLLSSSELDLSIRIMLLSSLGAKYQAANSTQRAIECYSEILKFMKDIDADDAKTAAKVYNAFKSLVKIYKEQNNSAKLIECYEMIISNLDYCSTEYVISVYEDLIAIHKDDPKKAIQYYNQYISNKELSREKENEEYFPSPKTREINHTMLSIFENATESELSDLLSFSSSLDPDIRIMILNQLVEHYKKSNNTQKIIECYNQIIENLSNPDIVNTNIMRLSIEGLIKIYKEKNDMKGLVECYEKVIKNPDYVSPAYLKSTIYKDLIEIHKDNPRKAIHYYNQYLLSEDNIYVNIFKEPNEAMFSLLSSISESELNSLLSFCIEENTKTYFVLLFLFAKKSQVANNTENVRKYYTQVLENIQKADPNDQNICKMIHFASMALKSIYRSNVTLKNPEKLIECCKIITDNPSYFSSEILKQTYKDLIEAYKDDTIKLIPYYIQYLFTTINAHKQEKDNPEPNATILSLLSGKDQTQQLKILEILFKNPDLWCRHNASTNTDTLPTVEEWSFIINSSNTLRGLQSWPYYRYFQYVTIDDSLNKALFLDDPTMDEWNILKQRAGDIDDVAFAILNSEADMLFDFISPMNEADDKQYIALFFERCQQSADAKTPIGKQLIRKRVASVVDYLTKMKAEYDDSGTTIEKKAFLKEKIQGALAIFTVAGMTCPDAAVVYLADLENYIKLLNNPGYLPNIMIQSFKRFAIQEKLIDPNNRENIETYLFYCLNSGLNNILNLGFPEEAKMLYERLAKPEPLEVALPKLSVLFNAEALINFTAMQYLFQLTHKDEFEKQKDELLQATQEAYLEADDVATDSEEAAAEAEKKAIEATDETNITILQHRAQTLRQEAVTLRNRAGELANELKNIEVTFYKRIAEGLFKKAGFIS